MLDEAAVAGSLAVAALLTQVAWPTEQSLSSQKHTSISLISFGSPSTSDGPKVSALSLRGPGGAGMIYSMWSVVNELMNFGSNVALYALSAIPLIVRFSWPYTAYAGKMRNIKGPSPPSPSAMGLTPQLAKR